jgi:hypothetical protein
MCFYSVYFLLQKISILDKNSYLCFLNEHFIVTDLYA